MQQYKDKHLFDDRLKLSSNIMERYPDRIPVICEPKDNDKITLDKKKFLCPRDFKMGHFLITLRKRLKEKLRSSEALYIFSNNTALPNNLTMEEIYEKCKDEDGLLYFTFDKENTFGSFK
jgi:GABA(A) receptor-associated protein